MSTASQPAKVATAAQNNTTGGENGTGSPATLGFSIQLLATNIFAGSTGSPAIPSTSSSTSQPSPQLSSPNPGRVSSLSPAFMPASCMRPSLLQISVGSPLYSTLSIVS